MLPNFVFRANFIAQIFYGKTEFCLTEFMPERFHPMAALEPPIKFEHRYALDNAFLTFYLSPIMVRLGKQQIPWGTGYVWNPTNIFHPVSSKRMNLARDYLFLRASHPAMDHLMEIECSTIIKRKVQGGISEVQCLNCSSEGLKCAQLLVIFLHYESSKANWNI